MSNRKPLDHPMQVAKAFIRDMRAYHAESNAIKKDEIAARRAWSLSQYQSGKKVRLSDVKRMFANGVIRTSHRGSSSTGSWNARHADQNALSPTRLGLTTKEAAD